MSARHTTGIPIQIKCQIIFFGNGKAGSWQKKSSCKPLASQHSEKVNFGYSYRGVGATRAVHAGMGVHVGVSPQQKKYVSIWREAQVKQSRSYTAALLSGKYFGAIAPQGSVPLLQKRCTCEAIGSLSLEPKKLRNPVYS